MNDIFEKASRAKLRFTTVRGNLSVEQLWDLPLDKGEVNLYQLAQGLKQQRRQPHRAAPLAQLRAQQRIACKHRRAKNGAADRHRGGQAQLQHVKRGRK